MTSRLGISPDKKARMREKAKNTMKRLRESTEKLIESKERARLQKMNLCLECLMMKRPR
jgi:hypothetical protein